MSKSNMTKHLEFQSKVYKRKLLIELYSPQKFLSPGVFIRENDTSIISYDLAVNPSNPNATIGINSWVQIEDQTTRAIGPFSEPIQIESAEQMRNVFGDL